MIGPREVKVSDDLHLGQKLFFEMHRFQARATTSSFEGIETCLLPELQRFQGIVRESINFRIQMIYRL